MKLLKGLWPDGKTYIELGRRNCRNCNERGAVPGRKPCPKCNGTGKTKGGKGVGECRSCYGYKTAADFENNVICPKCNGAWENFEEETLYDYMPHDIAAEIMENVKVYDLNRPMTLNEEYIGLGYVFTCTDYGVAAENPNAAIISVKEHLSVQLIKVGRPTDNPKIVEVCDHIGIYIGPYGYVVKAEF